MLKQVLGLRREESLLSLRKQAGVWEQRFLKRGPSQQQQPVQPLCSMLPLRCTLHLRVFLYLAD